ncbi:hypothetical protein [Parafrankia elaeagni]|uniref:hypothetical protein n=1 Tax=Parafrankia elaeagni TaxID=222534 RepID=UPI0003A2EC4A|nr:hypothetical protein [Parafrankia elaeagni]
MTSWRPALPGPGRGRWWKVLGLASVVGVAAGGAALARSERTRRAYTPDEVRARLISRHAEASDEQADEQASDGPAPSDQGSARPAGSAGSAAGWRDRP